MVMLIREQHTTVLWFERQVDFIRKLGLMLPLYSCALQPTLPILLLMSWSTMWNCKAFSGEMLNIKALSAASRAASLFGESGPFSFPTPEGFTPFPAGVVDVIL